MFYLHARVLVPVCTVTVKCCLQLLLVLGHRRPIVLLTNCLSVVGLGSLQCGVQHREEQLQRVLSSFQIATWCRGIERERTHPSLPCPNHSLNSTNPNITGCPVCCWLPLKFWCQCLCTLHPVPLLDTSEAAVGKHPQEMLHPGLAFSPWHEWNAFD